LVTLKFIRSPVFTPASFMWVSNCTSNYPIRQLIEFHSSCPSALFVVNSCYTLEVYPFGSVGVYEIEVSKEGA
jgi:hypothetical protein